MKIPMVNNKGFSKAFYACPGTIYHDGLIVNKFIDLKFSINETEEVLSVMVNDVTVAFPFEYAMLLAKQTREMKEEDDEQESDCI